MLMPSHLEGPTQGSTAAVNSRPTVPEGRQHTLVWSPNSVTYGLRHQNVFGFLGRAGDIIDSVREKGGSKAMPSDLFSKIQWPNPITARMMNDDQALTVDFSIEGVILNANLDALNWSRDRVRELFLALLNIALPISRGISSINRIGIIENYEVPQPGPGDAAISSLTRLQGLGSATDFNLRTAFRHPPNQEQEQAGFFFQASNEDWRNTILQIATRKRDTSAVRPDTLRISIDHQTYYVPERSFSPALVQEHYEHFVTHVDSLQRGILAGLAPQERIARHGT
jgi:hypothetical protein